MDDTLWSILLILLVGVSGIGLGRATVWWQVDRAKSKPERATVTCQSSYGPDDVIVLYDAALLDGVITGRLGSDWYTYPLYTVKQIVWELVDEPG